jgi:hypothetical protein
VGERKRGWRTMMRGHTLLRLAGQHSLPRSLTFPDESMPPYFFVTRIPSQLRLAARNARRVMPSSRRSSPSRKWDCGEGKGRERG